MSIGYSMDGVILARRCPEVDAIVKEFNEEGGNLQLDELENAIAKQLKIEVTDKMQVLFFNGWDDMSYGRAGNLDAIAEKLSAYVIEPAIVNTDADGENDQLYIGPDDKRTETFSAEAFRTVESDLNALTRADLLKLRDLIEDKLAVLTNEKEKSDG